MPRTLRALRVPLLLLVLMLPCPAPVRAQDWAAEVPATLQIVEPPPSFGPAVWMRIPRIGVNSSVEEVGVEGGYYGVPWFAVGHHVESVQPGELGNSVFNGHVLTINAGRVFERLHLLEPGDAVYVYTPTHRTDWMVADVFSVADGDDSFIQPTPDTRLTLYTCTGTFSPLEQNYSERLVVVAQLVQAVPRT